MAEGTNHQPTSETMEVDTPIHDWERPLPTLGYELFPTRT